MTPPKLRSRPEPADFCCKWGGQPGGGKTGGKRAAKLGHAECEGGQPAPLSSKAPSPGPWLGSAPLRGGGSFALHKSDFCSTVAHPRTAVTLSKFTHGKGILSPKIYTQRSAGALTVLSAALPPPNPSCTSRAPPCPPCSLHRRTFQLSTCCPLQAVQVKARSPPFLQTGGKELEGKDTDMTALALKNFHIDPPGKGSPSEEMRPSAVGLIQ